MWFFYWLLWDLSYVFMGDPLMFHLGSIIKNAIFLIILVYVHSIISLASISPEFRKWLTTIQRGNQQGSKSRAKKKQESKGKKMRKSEPKGFI